MPTFPVPRCCSLQALLAFQEVMDNPAALEKYREDHPALYSLLKKLTMGA